MVDPFSSAHAKLAVLADDYNLPGSLNEATTRLQIIDRLLMDCLGWDPSDIRAETHFNGEYVDYEIGSPAVEMIWEAKKEGIPFTLPVGVAGRRQADLSSAITDEPTKKAIDQVMRYCQDRGVPIAVICNGHQLIAFYASRQDGVPPLDGRCLCFSSLGEMRDDFRIFWSHLSRDGIAARSLQRVLLGRTYKALAPDKLSLRLTSYPGFRARTGLETNLKILAGLFLQDLENEPSVSDDFIEKCYVETGALSQYANVSTQILQTRYDALRETRDIDLEPATTKRGITPELSPSAVAAALTRRPLIWLGDVGVGKSMFLRHLIRVSAKDVLGDSLVFYIDFGKEPALVTNLEAYVAAKIMQQLRLQYDIDVNEDRFVRAVYNGEINRFKRSPAKRYLTSNPAKYDDEEYQMLQGLMKDSSEHLRRSLEHIRGTQQRASVIVLDNIDQRPPDFQKRVFLIGQLLADTWPSTVFLALRPATFYESSGDVDSPLSAYLPRVFTIGPTRTDQVISGRLKWARAELDVAEESKVFPANLAFSRDDMRIYLDVLIRAFENDERLKELIDNLSGGNLRLALTFLSSFIGSGYVSTQRILDSAAEGRTYVIPPHEFIRAIIYGEYDYFDPTKSAICNLFDITTDDGREHFLLSLMLAHVQRTGEIAAGNGFVDVSELYALSQSLGFVQEQVGPHIVRALSRRLLEAPQGRGAGGPLRITTVGSYMYKSMITQFSYVDAMLIDTPIVDFRVRAQIRDVKPILDRLDRAEVFRSYLDAQWTRLHIADQQPAFTWPERSADLAADIAYARGRALRAREQER